MPLQITFAVVSQQAQIHRTERLVPVGIWLASKDPYVALGQYREAMPPCTGRMGIEG